MDIRFGNLQYDYVNDKPFVIFKDRFERDYHLTIDHHTANDILNLLDNSKKESYFNNFYNIFVDFFNISDIEISNLSIDKSVDGKFSGSLTIKKESNSYCYNLNSDDIIFFSLLFDRAIKISKNIFYNLDVNFDHRLDERDHLVTNFS